MFLSSMRFDSAEGAPSPWARRYVKFIFYEKRFGMSLVKHVVGEMEGQRALTDCEIRDFETFSSLVPPSLQPLFRRLRDAGVLVCL